MTARYLAMACLLYVSAPAGRSESIAPAAADVDVYLKTGQGTPTRVLEEMKSELASLMRASGVRIEWRIVKESKADSTSAFAVVVELRGQCGVTSHADWPEPAKPEPVKKAAPLASSAVVDGYVLPFSWIDCAALNRLVGPAIADEPGTLRDYMYGRALARLLAHELYHVLTQTTGHAQAGIAKAQFTAAELLSGGFQFTGSPFMSQMPKAEMAAPADSELARDELDDLAAGK